MREDASRGPVCKQGQQLDVSENKCMRLYEQVVMVDRVVELGRTEDY